MHTLSHLNIYPPNHHKHISQPLTHPLVSDFGTTTLAYTHLKGKEGRHRLVDNPTWLAPEILRGDDYDMSADVYAFGGNAPKVLRKFESLKIPETLLNLSKL